MKKIILFLLFLFVNAALFAQFTNYYSKPSGNITLLSTWGTNPNGTGTSPTSFNANNCRYYVHNRTSTTLNGAGNFIIGGNNSVLHIGTGLTNSGFTVPAGYLLKSDSLYIDSASALYISGTVECAKAHFSYYSSVNYTDTNAMQPIMAGSYGKLVLMGIPTTSMWNDTRTKKLKGHVQARNTITIECILYCDTFSLTIGQSPTQPGILYYDNVNFWGRVVGKVKRWIPATSNNQALFPFGSPDKKHQLLYINNTIAPTVGGLLSAEYFPYFPGNAGLPLVDTSSNPDLNINKVGFGFYHLAIESGLVGGKFNLEAKPINISNVNWEGALRMIKRDGVSNAWRLEPGSYGGGFSAFMPSIGINGTTALNGQYAIASDSVINYLPIKLIHINGNLTPEQISLFWSTSSEINAKEFVVSVLDQTEWKVAKRIDAFGNSNQIRNYQCVLNNASKANEIALKLEAFDRDGSLSYSKEIYLENNNQLANISLYPNPFSEQLNLHFFGSNQNAFAEVFIIDQAGKTVLTEKLNDTNVQDYVISTKDLSPGLYLIKVVQQANTYFYRHIKL